MKRLASGMGLAFGVWISCSCAAVPSWDDHLQHEFEDAQRRYTLLIRWAEFDRASEYVERAARADFLAQAETLAEVRFTDYSVRSKELDEAHTSATARVLYRAYRISSMTETTFEEHQEWHRELSTGFWRVRPELVELRTQLAPAQS